jgi:hypothetical protein
MPATREAAIRPVTATTDSAFRMLTDKSFLWKVDLCRAVGNCA